MKDKLELDLAGQSWTFVLESIYKAITQKIIFNLKKITTAKETQNA